jgi:threonine dehydratase
LLSAHILSEPGSAARLAALEHHPRLATQGGPIVIVVTGANVDAAALARILSTRNR